MKAAALFAKIGNKALAVIIAILVLFLLLYGGYSIWDTYMKMSGAFISNDLLRFKPQPGDVPANESLADLMKINSDVRGWITIDDTHIDYPVVQGRDDMEYINKDVYGNFELSGSIFLSSLNAPDFSDQYNIVYGHHMDNGAMFGDLIEFLKDDYFNSHTGGTLYLRGATYHINLYSIVDTDAYDYIYYVSEANNGSFDKMASHIKDISVHYRDIGVTSQDKLIVLSTCQTADTNGRTLLVGRLEPIGFSEHGVVVNDTESEPAPRAEIPSNTGQVLWRLISRIIAIILIGLLILMLILYIRRKVHDSKEENL